MILLYAVASLGCMGRDMDAENARIHTMLQQRQTQSDSERANTERDEKTAASTAIGQRMEELRQQNRSDEADLAAKRLVIEKKHAREKWLATAPDKCGATFSDASCKAAPDDVTPEQKAACDSACKDTIALAATQLYARALDECAQSNEVTKQCEMSLPATSFEGDTAKQDASLADAKAACSKECSEGRAALRVAEGLVLSYKKCMLATDSTRQALTYRIHDSELYRNLMAKADERCRSANRCDWLEERTDDWRCSYGNQ